MLLWWLAPCVCRVCPDTYHPCIVSRELHTCGRVDRLCSNWDVSLKMTKKKTTVSFGPVQRHEMVYQRTGTVNASIHLSINQTPGHGAEDQAKSNFSPQSRGRDAT